MSAPPRPRDEAQRLALLQSYGILDSEPEAGFDDITRLASLICGVPIALVSMVDDDRQWFKARVGLPVPETAREVSFCAHAIVTPRDPFVVNDTFEDARFVDNPLVTGEPNIRFYAGVPLVLEDGHAVGTLCVIDRTPRSLSVSQLEGLELLARQVTNELRRRRRPRSPAPSARDAATAAIHNSGTIGGRYHVEEVLGVGGMGIVVAATDRESGSPVAIKFILPEAFGDEMIARFIREARALVRLGSAHVTRILDVGNLGNGAPFIVMERLEGEDLNTVLDARGALPYEESISYLLQACAGVSYVHAAGILHRDLKPANLFLARRPGEAPLLKVLDFGIAKLIEGATPIDRSTGIELLGSPHYMAPEQLTVGATLDARTDVWSLGVVLYELLAYRRPFEGETAADICMKVLAEPPTPLGAVRHGVPAAVERIIDRCLAKDRSDRYPSVSALAADLAAITRPIPAHEPGEGP